MAQGTKGVQVVKEPLCGIRFRAPAHSLWSSLHIFLGCWVHHCLDKGKSAQLAGDMAWTEVWREPGDKCLLESSVRRRKGWEEPRVTNTGNEFSTTTSSLLFGPPLLYSPELNKCWCVCKMKSSLKLKSQHFAAGTGKLSSNKELPRAWEGDVGLWWCSVL